VVLYRLNPGGWGKQLHALPHVRLLAADITGETLPSLRPRTLIVSRLNRTAAAQLAPDLRLRESDLRRLPKNRIIVQKGAAPGTATRRGE